MAASARSSAVSLPRFSLAVALVAERVLGHVEERHTGRRVKGFGNDQRAVGVQVAPPQPQPLTCSGLQRSRRQAVSVEACHGG